MENIQQLIQLYKFESTKELLKYFGVSTVITY